MGRSEGITFNVSEDLHIRISERADAEHDGNISDAVRELVRRGFESEEEIAELEAEIEAKDERIEKLLDIVEELSRE